MSFFEELKRRNVVRTAVLYLVAAWLSLQVTDVLASLLPLPKWAGSLVVLLLVLGFPIILIASWVYEMTPEGLKLDKNVNRSQSVSHETGRKINTLIIVLLVVAIAVVAVDRLLPETATVTDAPIAEPAIAVVASQAPERSVAVLPFANRSAREGDSFFVDGIHDDILTQLARIDSLTVISRTSVEKFRDTTKSMKEIGDVLGVKNILEGGVQRAGDRVRINVQLIDVSTDDHLWAETYDRELTTANIFGIQSEISTAIAKALKATLSPEEQDRLKGVPTENLAALEAYFLGKQSMAKRTGAALADAVDYFEQAIELDPDFALAYVGQAASYNLQTDNGNLSPKEAFALGQPLLDRALKLDDQSAEAYAALGSGLSRSTDRDAAEAAFQRALDLGPNYASAHHWYSMLLRSFGEYDAGLTHIQQAIRLDPLSSVLQANLGTVLFELDRPEDAIAQYRKTIEMDAAFPASYWSTGGIYWTQFGRLDEALTWFKKGLERNPGNAKITALIGLLYLDLGDEAEAERWINTALENAPEDYFSIWSREMFLLFQGERTQAREYAKKVLEQDPTWALSLSDLGNQDLLAGFAADASARYENQFPMLFDDDDPKINGFNVDAAINLGLVMTHLERPARAQLLLDRSLDYADSTSMPRSHWYTIAYGIPWQVQIYALQGETERALMELRQAVDSGWRGLWWYWLEHDPKLESIRHEPEFQAMVVEIKADMAAQLVRVRAMQANSLLE
jgi:TolB-like protein/Tfp pilus assembly protein PilF